MIIKIQNLSPLFLIIGFLLIFSTVGKGEEVNFLAVPHLATAPTLDGKVDQREWTVAALLPPLAESKDGLVRNSDSRIYMGWKDEYLYIGISRRLTAEERALSQLPTLETWNLPKEPAVKAVETVASELRVMSKEEIDKEDHYAIAFAASGKTPPFEIRISPSGSLLPPSGKNSEEGWICKTRTSSGNWEAEMQIPIAWCGGMTATVPVTIAWNQSDGKNLPETLAIQLARSQEDVACRFIGAGQFGRTQGLEIELVNGKATPFSAPIQIKLLENGKVFDQLTEKNAIVAADGARKFRLTSPWKCGVFQVAYQVGAEGKILAKGGFGFESGGPLRVDIIPFYLERKGLCARIETFDPGISSVQWKILDASGTKTLAQASLDELNKGKLETFISIKDIPSGSILLIEAKEGNKLVATRKEIIQQPVSFPDWWTMQEGLEPRVPPPWTPVKADANRAEIWGRQYEFTTLAVPAQVETQGKKILSGPMEFLTSKPWEKSLVKLVKQDEEMVVYESESVAGGLTLKVRSQVEFDGFMYVDLDLVGEGSVELLDFVIPFKKEHAILMQNYFKASGPGDLQWKNPNEKDNPYKMSRRFVGFVPDYPLPTPPMLTTWIGTDHYGLEWSCESSRGWAMSDPNKGMEVIREGETVKLVAHLINKTVALSHDKPRHIRFGLVATPTKAIMPYLDKIRWNDNFYNGITPYQWGEYTVWHPPLKNAEWIEKDRNRIDSYHKAGNKLMMNGGWHVSTAWPDWGTWGREMIADPLQNQSFSDAKQFGSCWNSPFSTFMVNSFGYNARLLKFDGIRFDTVVPSSECQSLAHGCGWTDDDGNVWPSYSIFAQREAMKKLYRIFHGGVCQEGAIDLPTAAGPIMAVHSFCDLHEIGESYYEKAKTLKLGYPPDMVRAMMPGVQYGFMAQTNQKGAPLGINERIAALLVNGGEPRFGDYRFWICGYDAFSEPAPNIWNAWGWVDRASAEWLGWWENSDYVKVNAGDKQVLASFWMQKGKKVLLVVTNYETDPLDDLVVKLDLARFGLKGKVYAEDAITLEPLELEADGTLKLDVLAQRYRLVMISNEPPRYREEALGPMLGTAVPAEIKETWQSSDIPLEPNAQYVLKALVKIDKTIGEESSNPNMWGGIFHYVSFQLVGEGIEGVNGRQGVAPCLGKGSDEFTSYGETTFYQRAWIPKVWEKTPGWVTMFLPVRTTEKATLGKLTLTITDPGQALLKNVTLQKVK